VGAEQRFRQPPVGRIQPTAGGAWLDLHDLARELWLRRAMQMDQHGLTDAGFRAILS